VTYWLASALLLRMHSGIICQTRFWILIRIPIRCFMFSQLFLFGILKQDIIFLSPLEYSAITKSNIIFAFTLLTMAKKMIAFQYRIGNYIAISAYGIIVSFDAIAHSVIHTPYPHFTAACWAFAVLGKFIYILAIYFSAVSVSKI
jgi:hypothetical protein